MSMTLAAVLPNGAVLAKPDYLAGLRSGRIHYDVLEVECLTVQVFGDFAFAWGRARVKVRTAP
jgi:hypothetical protein